MGAPTAIPESLHAELLALYGEHDPVLGRRRTFRDLSAWLSRAHGIDASREAVRRVVQPMRAEIAELRREVLRETIAMTLPGQLDVLDDLMEKAKKIASKPKATAGHVLGALDEYRKAVETKLRFGGVSESLKVDVTGDVTVDDKPVRDARDELAAVLAREAAGAARRGTPGGSGEPDAGGR
jgi:hypothetical protein